MRYLFIFRLYSGFTTSITARTWQPFGLPDVYKLIEGISKLGIPATVILLSREEEPQDLVPRVTRITFDGIGVDFYVVPSYRLFALIQTRLLPSRIGARLARLYNDTRQFWTVISRFCRNGAIELVYLDRRNIVLAAVLSLLGHRTVVRFHGVADWNRHRSALAMFLRQPLYYLALKTRFDLVLSSEDGSPVKPFFERYLHRITPYRILLNGVDCPESVAVRGNTLRQKYRFTEEWPVLLFVSRLTPDKGAREFLDAIAEVNRRCNRFYVLIVAGGTDYTDAKAHLERAGLGERVAFERSVPHRDILAYFRDADIFISCNKLANLTNTILEAMAAGLCIVMLGRDPVTRADESSETLIPDDVVVRIQRDNITPNLVGRLAELVENPDQIAAYRARLRNFATRFLCSWNSRIADEIQLLEGVATGVSTESADQHAISLRGALGGRR